MNWIEVTDNEVVINLLKQREVIEEQISTLDSSALVKYALQKLSGGLPSECIEHWDTNYYCQQKGKCVKCK